MKPAETEPVIKSAKKTVARMETVAEVEDAMAKAVTRDGEAERVEAVEGFGRGSGRLGHANGPEIVKGLGNGGGSNDVGPEAELGGQEGNGPVEKGVGGPDVQEEHARLSRSKKKKKKAKGNNMEFEPGVQTRAMKLTQVGGRSAVTQEGISISNFAIDCEVNSGKNKEVGQESSNSGHVSSGPEIEKNAGINSSTARAKNG